jgi:hypothetical protein
MSNWIKLHRKIQDSTMYRSLNAKQRDILIQCLILANYEECEWEYRNEPYKCKPGQFITSLPSLQKCCAKDVSIQNIRTCLLILCKWHFLTCESTKQNRLITIIKWEQYQNGDVKLTGKSTDGQQATNRQLTSIEEYKKIRREYMYSLFYDHQLSLIPIWIEKYPDTEKDTILYTDFVNWLFGKNKYLRRDIDETIIDTKKHNLLNLKNQLRFQDFGTLMQKCRGIGIKFTEILKDMENYNDLKKKKDFYRTALTFISNRIKK